MGIFACQPHVVITIHFDFLGISKPPHGCSSIYLIIESKCQTDIRIHKTYSVITDHYCNIGLAVKSDPQNSKRFSFDLEASLNLSRIFMNTYTEYVKESFVVCFLPLITHHFVKENSLFYCSWLVSIVKNFAIVWWISNSTSLACSHFFPNNFWLTVVSLHCKLSTLPFLKHYWKS